MTGKDGGRHTLQLPLQTARDVGQTDVEGDRRLGLAAGVVPARAPQVPPPVHAVLVHAVRGARPGEAAARLALLDVSVRRGLGRGPRLGDGEGGDYCEAQGGGEEAGETHCGCGRLRRRCLGSR